MIYQTGTCAAGLKNENTQTHHVMGMLHLAPEIQQHILSTPDVVRRRAITERALRPIAQLEDHHQQRDAFIDLLDSGR